MSASSCHSSLENQGTQARLGGKEADIHTVSGAESGMWGIGTGWGSRPRLWAPPTSSCQGCLFLQEWGKELEE